MKKVSAGIVITNGRVVLGCQASRNNWDLPKGEIEEKDSVILELY